MLRDRKRGPKKNKAKKKVPVPQHQHTRADVRPSKHNLLYTVCKSCDFSI